MTSRSIQKIQHYTINAKTLMICPDVDPHQCLIYEGEDLYLCESTSFDIVDQSCMSRGTTLDGRRQAVKSILENKHKPPIPIDTEKDLFLCRQKSCGISNVHGFHTTTYILSMHIQTTRQYPILHSPTDSHMKHSSVRNN